MNEAWKDALLLTLNHACSQNPSLIKDAEEKLKSWEREPGFYSLLMVSVVFTFVTNYDRIYLPYYEDRRLFVLISR